MGRELLPFEDLERQARRLNRLILALVATIVFLPAIVFVILEIDHLRIHARETGRQLASTLTSQLKAWGPDPSAISGGLRRELEVNHLLSVRSIRLIAPGGGESLRLGEPGEPLLPIGATVPLAGDAAALGELRIQADDRPLLRRASRILTIHLIVAGLVAVIVYRVPMRALHRAIDQLERTYAQLVHSDRLSAIGEMSAGVAHEINNPLAILLARVKILTGTAAQRGLAPDVVTDLEVIERHGSRIAETVRNLLAFARRASFEPIETDLNRVVGEVASLVERPFAKQSITIRRDFAPSLPALRASPDQLQQVFMNLLNNARDAMPDGGTITLRTYRDERRVVAEVGDTGVGIAPDVQGKIFEPFFTTKEVGKGTGLGLSVSYGIVRAHGGDIEVESRPGEGALFRVTLPAAGEKP